MTVPPETAPHRPPRSAPSPECPAGSAALDADAIRQVANCLTTLRSVRRFHPDPVPEALIEFVIHLATRAGSGKNRQPWRFIVVRDTHRRAALATWYRETWEQIVAADPPLDDTAEAQARAATNLAANLSQAPVIIVVCFLPIPTNPANFVGGASVYPAVQNLLLAARSVGLGATLTTLHADERAFDAGGPLRALLGIPDGVELAAVLPVGYPRRRFAPTARRLPVDEVTFADAWGHPWGER